VYPFVLFYIARKMNHNDNGRSLRDRLLITCHTINKRPLSALYSLSLLSYTCEREIDHTFDSVMYKITTLKKEEEIYDFLYEITISSHKSVR
jgi:hypothetical protein